MQQPSGTGSFCAVCGAKCACPLLWGRLLGSLLVYRTRTQRPNCLQPAHGIVAGTLRRAVRQRSCGPGCPVDAQPITRHWLSPACSPSAPNGALFTQPRESPWGPMAPNTISSPSAPHRVGPTGQPFQPMQHTNRKLTPAQRRRHAQIRAADQCDFPRKRLAAVRQATGGLPAAIRQARKRQGLTWCALAQKAGIPNQATTGDIEQGKDVKLSSLEAVARALGLKLELVPTADQT